MRRPREIGRCLYLLHPLVTTLLLIIRHILLTKVTEIGLNISPLYTLDSFANTRPRCRGLTRHRRESARAPTRGTFTISRALRGI